MNLFSSLIATILIITQNSSILCNTHSLKHLTLTLTNLQPCLSHLNLTKLKPSFATKSKLPRGLHDDLWKSLQDKVSLYPLQSDLTSSEDLNKDLQGEGLYSTLMLQISQDYQSYPQAKPTYPNMMPPMTRKGSSALHKIEGIRLINKKKNDKICKQQEEEEKQRKYKKEARRIQEEAEKEDETITPRNLHDVMNGLDYSLPKAMEENDEGDERSPLKKRSGSSKSAARRTRAPQVSPPEPPTTAPSAPPPTKTTTFLDLIIYSHSQTVIELAIALKSNKAFKEFTQALMAFITNAQMVDSKFIMNALEPNSKEKNISS
jgi:hypothetical protein